jgi:hypothetical protein
MQGPSVRKQETILARNKQRSENVDGAACLKLQKITVRTYGNLLCRVLATEQEVKLNATASHCCCLANSGALLMATTCRLLCWVTDRPEVRTGSVKAIAARQWVCLGRTRTPRDGIDYGISNGLLHATREYFGKGHHVLTIGPEHQDIRLIVYVQKPIACTTHQVAPYARMLASLRRRDWFHSFSSVRLATLASTIHTHTSRVESRRPFKSCSWGQGLI